VHVCVWARADAYSVKHIAYRWMKDDDSVGYNKEMQLPQFEMKGYRVDTRVEPLSTGTAEYY